MIIDLTEEEAEIIEVWYNIAERESYTDPAADKLIAKFRALPDWPF